MRRSVENLTPCCLGPSGSGWVLPAERNNPSRIISGRAVIGCGAERNPSRIISRRAVTGCGQDEWGRHRFIIIIIIIIIIMSDNYNLSHSLSIIIPLPGSLRWVDKIMETPEALS